MAPPQKSSFKINDESAPEGKWNGKYEDFKTLGDNLDIKTFSNSAAPYGDAQGLLITTYEELTTQAYQLADLWQGKAAAEFQNNLKALYQSACALADATGKVNVAIGYHASDLETLKENVDKMKPDESKSFNDYMFGDTWDPLGISHRTTDVEDHKNQANQKVQDWINKDLTNNTTSYTFTELPKDVHLELPNPDPGKYDPIVTPDQQGGPGGHLGGGGGGGTSHLNTPNSHLTTPNSHLTTPNSHLTDPSSLRDQGGTDLAGLKTHSPTGLGGGGLSDGLGGPGGLGGLDPHGGGGGGLGGGGLGGGGLGGGGLGGLGSRGSGSSARLGGAAAEEAAAARAAGAGKGGMNGGMPMGMGGGAGGGQEQERERTTWLTEDEDVWGGDDDVAPPVIG
jgi:uncharacterized protein YukE